MPVLWIGMILKGAIQGYELIKKQVLRDVILNWIFTTFCQQTIHDD